MVTRVSISVTTVAALLVAAVSTAQKNDKKTDEAQKRDIPVLLKAVDDVAAGQPAPNDFNLAWVGQDFMKAEGKKTYVPFTFTLDPTVIKGGTVALYWRLVSKNPPPAAVAPAPVSDSKDKKDDKKDKDKDKKGDKDKASPLPKRPEFAYEDYQTLSIVSQKPPMRVSRSLGAPAGDYDLYVEVKEPSPPPDKSPAAAAGAAPKVSVIKQSLTIPDFWNGELTSSSVILASRIDPLSTPLTAQQQSERPYALGALEIVPALSSKFTKASDLSVYFLIYNPKTDSANKPDVTVEYNFYVKAGGAEKFFNKTQPLNLNAQTLPPQFDAAAGHQLPGGQEVPLKSFPEGDYRLEIKVTDKLGNKSLTRDVNFTVSGS